MEEKKGFEAVNIHGTASGIIPVPVIGENGNWFIGNDDTGIAAQGIQGVQGPKGDKGDPGSFGSEEGDGIPVGTIISYMGTKAPAHYLVCDGKVFNISDYQHLSNQILDEFGIVDYFGGDGEITFAVPDLRNEFLRGYYGKAVEQLSGEVGKHQAATSSPYVYNNMYGRGLSIGVNSSDVSSGPGNTTIIPGDMDTVESSNHGWMSITGTTNTSARPYRTYTSRPKNVAVLYCIKYE